ncbi:NusA N-terminal domain-containing protein, partial [Aliarcobacter butzleri]
MDKIIDILDSIAYEKGLKIDDVENSLKEALIKTAQRMVDTTLIFDANIDRANKKLELFQKIEVVSKDDDRLKEGSLTKEGTPINPENYISLEEAKEINSDLDIGDFMSYELEFENMGRNAATILLSNFEFRLQRFVEENIVGKYKEKVGKTVSGTVTRIDKSDNTYIEIGEIKGILQRKSRIKGEFFKVGDVVKAVVKSVNIDKTNGLLVEISRTS